MPASRAHADSREAPRAPPSSREKCARVDHVVAVRRAAARLQRRRQVQVRDAEVAQVRDERARVGEPEVGGELETVGGPQLDRVARAHVARFSITTDRAITLTSVRAP